MSRIEHSQNIVVSEEEEEEDDDKVVETDPNGIYVRFEHKLGSGAFKTVYRALDTERGIEVAWNQVLIDRFQLDRDKVLREIEFFKQIRHQHVIDFYHFWTDQKKNQVVFITELMPSGTLTDYIGKSPEVKLKIIKSWCKQILAGLNYLHTQDPPIIHRDIKCGNIFINGTTEGQVKIGDLGLATFCQKKDALSVIGTPEFMAPEYYNEVYTTTVDIWAFGMAMIEMVTRQCPYAECDNVGQIFKKVSGGVRPQQLELILDPEVKAFINLCLADERERPTAAQLLEHKFFVSDSESDNNPVRVARPNEMAPVTPSSVLRQDTPEHLPSIGEGVDFVPTAAQIAGVRQVGFEPNVDQSQAHTMSLAPSYATESPDISGSSDQVPTVNRFDMRVVSREGDVLEIVAEMGIEDGETKETSEINFGYNLSEDDPLQTAIEMVKSFELDDASIRIICSAFEELVRKYPLSHDRAQTMTELSSLICNDPDLDPQPRRNLGGSGDSIQSEPARVRTQKFNYDPNVTLSDSETPFVGSSNMSDDGVTDLEFLVEDSDNVNLTILTHEVQDNTDLEDLLDDEDSIDNDDDDLFSDEGRSSYSKKSYDDEDDDTMISSSDGFSEEEDEEIQALKAKHEKDMLDLIQRQQKELRLAEQDLLRKKQSRIQQNENEPNGSHAETSRKLKVFYDDQQVRGKHSFRVSPSALCI